MFVPRSGVRTESPSGLPPLRCNVSAEVAVPSQAFRLQHLENSSTASRPGRKGGERGGEREETRGKGGGPGCGITVVFPTSP